MISNLGFYGHSNCAYRSADSYLDILASRFSAKVVNTGVRQGSEERILFELKKTKSLDFAVIVHSRPSFLFLPNCDRDIDVTSFSDKRAKYIMDESDFSSDFSKQHAPKMIQEFGTAEKFTEVMNAVKEHLYHPDLMLNRFYGSLIQIDQYLTAKNIPAVHILEQHTVPSWFTFSSGIVDYTIAKMFVEYRMKRPFFVNIVSKEGNIAIADKLETLINAACSR